MKINLLLVSMLCYALHANSQTEEFTMSDYEFIPPEGWEVQNNKEHIAIQNMQSGCIIRIIEPQPSSGNLEQDAKSVFEMMYQGWQYQKSGEQQYVLTKGFSPKGLEYFMIQAGMSKLSADGSRYDGFEEGSAMVVKAGSQIGIISIRHNTSFMGHTDCIRKYETMRRFFNSFTIRNVAITKKEEDAAQQIIGSWSMAEAGAAGEYVFAANGNYAFYGALGSISTSQDYNYEYLHIKTYSFQGDGSYLIAGNQLTLKKYDRDPEPIRFRFEKVNHGGTGWKDRVWMSTKNKVGETEVCYEKREK
jgi:hypothetical protein